MGNKVVLMTSQSEKERLQGMKRSFSFSPQVVVDGGSLKDIVKSGQKGGITDHPVVVEYDPLKSERKYTIKSTKQKAYVSGQMNTLPSDFYTTFNPRILDFTKYRDEKPLMYKDIYDTWTDSDFDENMDIKDFDLPGMAYTEILDGQAVTRGVMHEGTSGTVKLKINGTGFTTTLRNQLFNKRWKDSMVTKANMIAYNAFLNDTHLGPIINYGGYGDDDFNGLPRATAAVAISGYKYYENLYLTLKACIRDAAKRRLPNGFNSIESDKAAGQRFSSGILLTNEYDAMRIMDVMGGIPIADSKVYKNLGIQPGFITGISKIIGYDGDTLTKHKDEQPIVYPGVPENIAFYVWPKKGFKELIKQPLTPLVQAGNANNLSVKDSVWWDCRGLISQPQYYVQKVTLPAGEAEFA